MTFVMDNCEVVEVEGRILGLTNHHLVKPQPYDWSNSELWRQSWRCGHQKVTPQALKFISASPESLSQ